MYGGGLFSQGHFATGSGSSSVRAQLEDDASGFQMNADASPRLYDPMQGPFDDDLQVRKPLVHSDEQRTAILILGPTRPPPTPTRTPTLVFPLLWRPTALSPPLSCLNTNLHPSPSSNSLHRAAPTLLNTETYVLLCRALALSSLRFLPSSCSPLALASSPSSSLQFHTLLACFLACFPSRHCTSLGIRFRRRRGKSSTVFSSSF